MPLPNPATLAIDMLVATSLPIMTIRSLYWPTLATANSAELTVVPSKEALPRYCQREPSSKKATTSEALAISWLALIVSFTDEPSSTDWLEDS